ncbi:alpha/beta hydrolase family protein [Phormidium sp. CCY1219]|uniref:alpha/beta hydrolase family protein n=1 Tax=Phormidium sp. CCY1219 TaxID=2886104 RepID=UPI002D1F8D38|nr:alpha/beta hydrolase [Phormidium sp. CCY1219]MEB3831491.1 hypothetical protein [Phormidium sp. CCY1219]
MKRKSFFFTLAIAFFATLLFACIPQQLPPSTSTETSVQIPMSQSPPQPEPRPISEPLFRQISTFRTTIPANGDVANIYYPQVSENSPNSPSFPVALLLQGLNVDKSHYSQFATQVARYGFIVVVPNHFTTVRGRQELFAQVGEVPAVLSYVKSQNNAQNLPFYDIINADKLVLIGHSQGGFIGMDAIREACDMPFCEGDYQRPKELLAGVFFGADLWDGEYIKIENDGIAIALMSGSEDSLIPADSIQQTYEHIQTSPKAYLTLLGANHYAITNGDNPPGSPLEKNPPLLPQDIAIATLSRWSALFLRTYAFDDTTAKEYIYQTGDALDENVTVISQP